VAITTGAPHSLSVLMEPVGSLLPADQDGSASNPGGQKRPPRTTDIA
jgi:hypothetical protein